MAATAFPNAMPAYREVDDVTWERWFNPFPPFVMFQVDTQLRDGQIRLSLIDKRNDEVLDCVWKPAMRIVHSPNGPSEAMRQWVDSYKRALQESGV